MVSVFGLVVLTAALFVEERIAENETNLLEVWDQAYRVGLGGGRYLDAVALIDAYQPTEDEAWGWHQLRGTFRAYVGDADGALADFAQSPDYDVVGQNGSDQAELGRLTPSPATETLRELARSHRIVMINEAHGNSRQRAFMNALLRALRDDGFTHFAAETFHSETAIQITADGYLARNSGHYINDPVFADAVEFAHGSGMELVAYEITRAQDCRPECDGRGYARHRERMQAENLASALADDPDARVLVHVGMGHHSENTAGRETVFMGTHLAEMLGEDPLTIDQLRGDPVAGWASMQRVWNAISNRYPLIEPTVFRRANGALFGTPFLDVIVFHPDYDDIQSRPHWFVDLLGREGVLYLLPAESEAELRLLQAFRVGDGPDAIPTDQILIEPGARAATLMLPEGEFRVVLQRLGEDDRDFHVVTIP